MSGVHFAVQCGPQGCRVMDRKSSNGTFLNGARIEEAILANGDEIRGGQTIFVVTIVADDNLPSDSTRPEMAVHPRLPPPVASAVAARQAPPANSPASPIPIGAAQGRNCPLIVMGWFFNWVPEQWRVQEECGIRRIVKDEFPSSVVATSESLGAMTLQQFVEAQISMLRGYLRDAKIEPAIPPRVTGADESMAVDVWHSTKDGKEIVYRRIYVRSGSLVGVLTVTAPADHLSQVLKSLQPMLDGAAFRPRPIDVIDVSSLLSKLARIEA